MRGFKSHTNLKAPPVFDLSTKVQIHLGHQKAIINSWQTLEKEKLVRNQYVLRGRRFSDIPIVYRLIDKSVLKIFEYPKRDKLTGVRLPSGAAT